MYSRRIIEVGNEYFLDETVKNVRSNKRKENHIVIILKSQNETREAIKELRKAIRRINRLSEEKFSFEIYC